MTDIIWEDFPWQQYKANQEIDLPEDQVPGRIISQAGPVMEVVSPLGTGGATTSGRLNYLADHGRSERPAVGDYVVVRTAEAWQVDLVLPRQSVYQRKEAGDVSDPQVICANADSIAIMTTPPAAANANESTSLADFNVRRIERFVATMDKGIRPVVILNKCDLVDDVDAVTEYVSAELPGADVLPVSALTGEGTEALEAMCRAGTTTVLVGSSGCGKSTLINRLTGGDIAVGAIRSIDGRGRHTTTTRRMHKLRTGGLLVDTPGMREIQLWSDEESGEDALVAFPEIAAIASECRFADCQHSHEPGCAVKAAVQSGEITHDRYLSFLELRNESANRRDDREYRERMLHRRMAKRSRSQRRS